MAIMAQATSHAPATARLPRVCTLVPFIKQVTGLNVRTIVIIQVNQDFHKLERVYGDCLKRTRDKTRILQYIVQDAPGA